MKKFFSLIAVTFMLCLVSLTAQAQYGNETATTTTTTATVTSAPDMPTPEQMEQWAKMSSPSENHKVLEAFTGKWDYTMKMWMKADSQPQESKGTSDNHWMYEGRFLVQDTKGEAMGKPFEGMGIIGYDNMREEYNFGWIDNMSTSMMVATGQYDPATKTLTESGTFACPMTGEKNRAMRSVWKIIDADHHSYEMYSTSEGQEFKMMEIMYTRAQ